MKGTGLAPPTGTCWEPHLACSRSVQSGAVGPSLLVQDLEQHLWALPWLLAHHALPRWEVLEFPVESLSVFTEHLTKVVTAQCIPTDPHIWCLNWHLFESPMSPISPGDPWWLCRGSRGFQCRRAGLAAHCSSPSSAHLTARNRAA